MVLRLHPKLSHIRTAELSEALSPFSSLPYKRTNVNTARHFFFVCHFQPLMYKEIPAEWVSSENTDFFSDLCNIELIHCGEVKITTLIFPLNFSCFENRTRLGTVAVVHDTEQKQTFSTL